jgi:hypothetical protein
VEISGRSLLVTSVLALLTACRDPPRPSPRPTPAPSPTPTRPSTPTPTVTADAATASADAAAAAPEGDGGAATGIRVYRVNPPTCVRDPSRERLGASAHGYFGEDRIELEVRNVRHGCTPGPTFTAALEGTTLHVRYDAPTRTALARCGCRHDQFLQIVGVPRGDYEVDVSPVEGEDAGAPIATGRITARAR